MSNTPSKPLANPRHEAYAQHRALGLSLTDAYRNAYPTVTKPTAAAAAARIERRFPEIRQRIADLQAEQIANHPELITKTELGLSISKAIRAAATTPEGMLLAVPLVAQYCKMFGFYAPDKIETSISLLSDAERDAKIAALIARKRPATPNCAAE